LQLAGLVVATGAANASAEPADAREPRVRLDGGLTLSRFEPQVKSEVGNEPGERLVEPTEIGLLSTLAYRFWGPLSAGGFLQFDAGERSAARVHGTQSVTPFVGLGWTFGPRGACYSPGEHAAFNGPGRGRRALSGVRVR
jgi:hypothetical protein